MTTDTNNLPVVILPDARPEVPDIIRRMLNGEVVSAIAKDYDYSTTTLYNWLAKGVGKAGTDAIRQEIISNQIVESGVMLSKAKDMLELARARAICKRTEWYAEKMCPEIYGSKPIVKSNPIEVVVNR